MRLVKISQHLRKAFAVMLPIFIIGCTRQQGRNPATPASLPFDRKTWIAQQAFDSETSPRWLMYDDLVNNHLPLGMTRAQVVELIGAGTVKLDNNMLLEEAGPAAPRIRSFMVYPLFEEKLTDKYQSSMSAELVVAFDANGRLCWKAIIAQ